MINGSFFWTISFDFVTGILRIPNFGAQKKQLRISGHYGAKRGGSTSETSI